MFCNMLLEFTYGGNIELPAHVGFDYRIKLETRHLYCGDSFRDAQGARIQRLAVIDCRLASADFYQSQCLILLL